MAAPGKTDVLVDPINPKHRSIMKTAAAIAGGSTVALIDPLVCAGAWATDPDAPRKTELKVGFIPFMDCASVVMISALGLNEKYDIRITPSKETLWVGIRDKLVSDDLDTTHVLYGLIYGVQLDIGDPKKDMAALMTLSNDGQAITLSSKLKGAGVKGGTSLKTVMAEDKREYVLAQAFPTGTHAMWLYYWLATHDIRPLQDAKAIAVPPPQMVANIRVGNMGDYCVGEPWGARAIADNIDFTAEATQAIWKDHPEKVPGTTAEFVQKYPNTAYAPTTVMLRASEFIDASASNHRKMAETIATRSYVNTDMDIVLNHMLGRCTNGLGRTWDDPGPTRFYHDGVVNSPYLSDGMRSLTQHKHWGLLKVHLGYLAVAKQVNRVDIFKQAATAVDTPLPRSNMRTARLIDGVVWDVKSPAAYTDGFKLKAWRSRSSEFLVAVPHIDGA